MLPTFFALALAAASLSAAAPSRKIQLIQCVAKVFGQDAGERIVSPDDPVYTDARIGESIQFDQLPTLIAYAKDADEVAPLIRCAKHAGIKAVPRTGGHHFLAYSALSGTLVIDISHIDTVTVSEDKSTAKVGAGIRLGALYTALAPHGKDWPGGICPTVGLSGFLGAGGFNMQMRTLGMAVDSVKSAKVVKADGTTVTASERVNCDLFWAIRGGGGGSFGIVVEWTLKLHEFPRSAVMLLRWNEPDTRVDVASRFFDWAPAADRRFTSQVNVHQNRTQMQGWCLGCDAAQLQSMVESSGLLKIGKPEVHITGGCSTFNARLLGFGGVDGCVPDEAIAQFVPQGFNTLPQPFVQVANFTQYKWDETPQDTSQPAALPWPRIARIAKSFFLLKGRRVGRDTIEEVVRRVDQLPAETDAYGEWHAWNITAPKNAAFAWGERAYGHMEFIVAGSTDRKTQAEYYKWSEEMDAYLRPITGPASYAGYMDSRLSVKPVDSYYGANVDRLSRIKHRYDPETFFTNPHAIEAH